MRAHNFRPVQDLTVGGMLDAQADSRSDRVWLRSDDRTVTFAEAAERSRRIAGGLAALGAVRRSVVALLMEPSIELVMTGVSAARIGTIFMPISTDFKGAFLADALADSTASILCVDAKFATLLDGLDLPGSIRHVVVVGDGAPGLPLPGVSVHDYRAVSGYDPAPAVAVEPTDPLMVWWSSGTTGRPKGITHSHASLLNAADIWASDRDVTPDDCFYTCLPMYLGMSWTGSIWPSLIAGVSAAIDPHFSVSQFWSRTRKYNATIISTLGSMHMYLLQAPERPDDKDNPVRFASPVPLPWELVPRFKERFAIAEVSQVYGQSETPCRVFWAPEDGTPWRANSIGRPSDQLWEVRLVDDQDQDVPAGEVGQIIARPRRSNLLFLGYFNAPDITAATWRDLWHHTGDLARRDADGQYYFADRKKDYIREKGRNISMVEVETVVQAHPRVKAVAAYGIASAALESESELALAVVVRGEEPVEFEELARYINDNAPYYFVPRYITVVDALPENAQFKVDKKILRELGVQTTSWDRDAAGFVPAR